MERLTERRRGKIIINGSNTVYDSFYRKRAHVHNCIVRLAAYEDTGLTPDEVAYIAEQVRSETRGWEKNGLETT